MKTAADFVSPTILSFTTTMNDNWWSCNEAREKGLRRLAVAQIGTWQRLDDLRFSLHLKRLVIGGLLADALTAAANMLPKRQKATYLALARGCKEFPSIVSALHAQEITNLSLFCHSRTPDDVIAVIARANAVAFEACHFAQSVDDRQWQSAAKFAALAAHKATLCDDNAADHILGQFCEAVVQILIDMKTPGSRLLETI